MRISLKKRVIGAIPLTVPVKNILLVRTDRIGDVVLSLPMLPLIKRRFPDASVTVLLRHYTRDLVEQHSCVDRVLFYEHEDRIPSLLEIFRHLRAGKFDVAILPYPRFRISILVFLSGIPVRVGTGYRWYSFLFTHRVYEHRKDAQRHEVEYNLNLLKKIGIESDQQPEFEFVIPEETDRKAASLLREKGIGSSDKFVILHPGSGGSARDWKGENFSHLGKRIVNELKCKVVVTGGKGEEVLVDAVARKMEVPNAVFANQLNLKELGALIRRASLFVSNSTGPLHIAAAVGTPVIGFYPPIIQCSPRRWGPYTDKKNIFTADNAHCPLCKGGPCRSNICMDQISVDDVVNAAKELMKRYPRTNG